MRVKLAFIWYYLWLVVLSGLVFLVPTGTVAQPNLNTVLKGSAQVSSTTTTTTITQTSQSTTLNWNSFDVSQNQRVTFNQPSSSSIAINNILDTSPSQIFGSITANGRIVLLNPNGFYFGAHSSVSANTFIAAATTLANSSYNPSTNSLSLVNRHDVVSDIQVLGSIHAQKVQLFAQTIEVSGTISSNQQGFISIRSNQDIRITGSISSHNGTIDIFALDGTASTSGTISTATGINDEAVEGFVEFSGSVIDIQPTAVFDLNPQDTLLFDPEYIVIVGGAIPTPCPPASSGIMDCGFTMGTELSGGTATVSAIYENTLEGVTAGTIRLQADFGIQFLGTFTSGLTLAPNVSLELETTLTTTAPAPTVTLGGVMTTLSQGITISENITVMNGDITIISEDDIRLDDTAITTNQSASLTSNAGSISTITPTNSITVGTTLTLSAIGAIGNNGSFLRIFRSSGSWDGNLMLFSSASGPDPANPGFGIGVYLFTSTADSILAPLTMVGGGSFTGTFSVEQDTGDIVISRRINLPDAFVRINASATGSDIVSMNVDPIDIVASAVQIRSTGSIGTAADPITIDRNGGTWSSTTLILNAGTTPGESLYISLSDAGATTATIGNLAATGTVLSIELTVGSLDLSSGFTTVAETIIFTASNGSITLDDNSFTNVVTLTLNANGSIIDSSTSMTPSITFDSATGGRLNLVATTGNVGSRTNPIRIRQPRSVFNTPNQSQTNISALSGSIFIRSLSIVVTPTNRPNLTLGVLRADGAGGDVVLSVQESNTDIRLNGPIVAADAFEFISPVAGVRIFNINTSGISDLSRNQNVYGSISAPSISLNLTGAGSSIGSVGSATDIRPLRISSGVNYTAPQTAFNSLAIGATDTINIERFSFVIDVLGAITIPTAGRPLGLYQTSNDVFLSSNINVSNYVFSLVLLDSRNSIIIGSRAEITASNLSLSVRTIGIAGAPLNIAGAGTLRLGDDDYYGNVLTVVGNAHLNFMDAYTLSDVRATTRGGLNPLAEIAITANDNNFTFAGTMGYTNSNNIHWILNANPTSGFYFSSGPGLFGAIIEIRFPTNVIVANAFARMAGMAPDLFQANVLEELRLVFPNGFTDTNLFDIIAAPNRAGGRQIVFCDFGGAVCRGNGAVLAANQVTLSITINAGNFIYSEGVRLDINTTGIVPGDTLLIAVPNGIVRPDGTGTRPSLDSGLIRIRANQIGSDANPLIYSQSQITPPMTNFANAYFISAGDVSLGATSDLNRLFCNGCTDILFVRSDGTLPTITRQINDLGNNRLISLVQTTGNITNSGGFNVNFRNCGGGAVDFRANSCGTEYDQFSFVNLDDPGATISINALAGSFDQGGALDTFTFSGLVRLVARDTIGESTDRFSITNSGVGDADELAHITLEAGSSGCTTTMSDCGHIYVRSARSINLNRARITTSGADTRDRDIDIVVTGSISLFGDSGSSVFTLMGGIMLDGFNHRANWNLEASTSIYSANSDEGGYISGRSITLTSPLVGVKSAVSSAGVQGLDPTYRIAVAILRDTLDANFYLAINSPTGAIANRYVNVVYDANRENCTDVGCPVAINVSLTPRIDRSVRFINEITSQNLSLGAVTVSGTGDNYVSVANFDGRVHIPNSGIDLETSGPNNSQLSVFSFNDSITCSTRMPSCLALRADIVRAIAGINIGIESSPITVEITNSMSRPLFAAGNDIF